MLVAVQGSKSFNDYQVFLRGIGTALREIADGDDKEFINVNERSLKAYGIKTKIVKIPPSWIANHLNEVDYMLYFSKPKEAIPPIVEIAEAKDIEVGVYRY